MTSFLSIPPISTDSDHGSVSYQLVKQTCFVDVFKCYATTKGMTLGFAEWVLKSTDPVLERGAPQLLILHKADGVQKEIGRVLQWNNRGPS